MSVQLLRGIIRSAALLRKKARDFKIGESFYDEATKLHFRRDALNLYVMDMTNAGKRGKRVPHFTMLGTVHGYNQEFDAKADQVSGAKNFAQALALAKSLMGDYRISVGESRGVDVPPMGGVVEINTNQFYLRATPIDFSLSNKLDRANRNRVIPSLKSGRTQAAKFFAWLQAPGNLAKLDSMSFSDVESMIQKVSGLPPHGYSPD